MCSLLVVPVARELETPVHMVVAIAIRQEDAPPAGSRHREWMHVGALLTLRRDEDARCIQLMTAKLGHQAASRSRPQTPANQLLNCRSSTRFAVELFEVRIRKLRQFFDLVAKF